MPFANPQDRTDFESLQRGDEAALDRLIARWEKPLLAFAWRYLRNAADARDLVAETFVRLYHHRQRLRPATNLSAWLFTTLANLCRNHHRWQRRHPTTSLDEPADSHDDRGAALAAAPIDPGATPDDALVHKELLEALEQAVAQLPHDLKTTLFLHHFEQLSYREIGDITGCQERGVETRLYRARQALRQTLARLRAEPVQS